MNVGFVFVTRDEFQQRKGTNVKGGLLKASHGIQRSMGQSEMFKAFKKLIQPEDLLKLSQGYSKQVLHV